MTYDPTDPAAVAAREQLRARERLREVSELRLLLTLPEYRRWLWRTLSTTQAFTASFHPDPLQTAFAEGRRSVGLWLLAELQEANPGEFAALISEAWAEANPQEDKDE